MTADWVGKPEQVQVAIAFTLGVGIATALLVTSRWWLPRRTTSDGKRVRKPLTRSPGIQVIHLKDESTTGGAKLNAGAVRGAKEGVSKWEQSRKKGDMGYYFAHHTSHKELAPEEYRMNGPRLLSKGEASPASCQGKAGNGAGNTRGTASPTTATRRKATQISSYSWEDCGDDVRLTFRQSGWDWSLVDEGEISVEWRSRQFRLSIDSREYGLHTMDLPKLSGEISEVRVLKMRNRLVVALVKGGRGSYSRKAPWSELQEKKPSRPDDLLSTD